VLLNVLIALMLEIYSSVAPEVREKAKRVDLAVQLNKIVAGVDKETLKERFDYVSIKLAKIEEQAMSEASSLRSSSRRSEASKRRSERFNRLNEFPVEDLDSC
jgi:hypothetical protein